MDDLEELLTQAKEMVKGEVTTIAYTTWISRLEMVSLVDNHITLFFDDAFNKDIVFSRYGALLENAFSILLQKNCTVSLISENVPDSTLSISAEPTAQLFKGSLNPKYTFENFVVGDNNRFAHAASFAIAEAPATAYNPLFLYGGVGLGKTHLMQAIGNEILKNNKNSKVLYVTSEAFTNEFINGVRDNEPEKFRQKYRNIDVLLIDDIQFISGKEGLQEEFFHTFNTLRDNEKQIVLSSDRPPMDIPLLEERLRSRFEMGLIADVSMADYETRLAILRKKTNENHVIIDDEILSNIAAKIDSNIRELEGIFNKLVAESSLTHTPITMEMSERAINDMIRQKESVISLEYIQEMICKFFNVTSSELKSSHRSNDIAFPRQVGMYLCRILTNDSFPKIGGSFGGRDHTTVMHAFKKIEKEIKENSQTKLVVESVKKLIINRE